MFIKIFNLSTKKLQATMLSTNLNPSATYPGCLLRWKSSDIVNISKFNVLCSYQTVGRVYIWIFSSSTLEVLMLRVVRGMRSIRLHGYVSEASVSPLKSGLYKNNINPYQRFVINVPIGLCVFLHPKASPLSSLYSVKSRLHIISVSSLVCYMFYKVDFLYINRQRNTWTNWWV